MATACLALGAAACTPAEPRIGWSIEFASDVPAAEARASVVHATIRAGDCTSRDVTYAADLAYGDLAPAPPALSRGTWAFVAEAVDDSCSVIASDCVAIAVPAPPGATVQLLLRASDPYPLCAPAECSRGRCGVDAGTAPDAGPDDAGPDDAGGVDACRASESQCTDGADDDCDGMIDCADSECAGMPCGGAESVCCGGACADTSTNDLHCGGCGNACNTTARFACTTGSCECQSGWTECAAGSCTNTNASETDCGTCGNACAPDLVCRSGTCGPQSATWRTDRLLSDCPSRVGSAFRYECQPNPTLTSIGSVYGTDTYTYNSAICPAAVHANRITAAGGGVVTVRIAGDAGPFSGSTRFGVTSMSRASSTCSYTFD